MPVRDLGAPTSPTRRRDGLGPIAPEQNEPVSHEPWEGRVFALFRATGALGRWPIDAARQEIERMLAVDYLRAQNDDAVEQRKAAWAEAYRATPHGRPVALPSNAAA